MKNAINWFEIPTSDLARAQRFYEKMLNTSLRAEIFGGSPLAIFPYTEPGVGGALIVDPHRQPSTAGALIYLDVAGDLDGALKRAAEAGGRVVLPRTDIGAPGFIGVVIDSEGNSIGLHSPK